MAARLVRSFAERSWWERWGELVVGLLLPVFVAAVLALWVMQ